MTHDSDDDGDALFNVAVGDLEEVMRDDPALAEFHEALTDDNKRTADFIELSPEERPTRFSIQGTLGSILDRLSRRSGRKTTSVTFAQDDYMVLEKPETERWLNRIAFGSRVGWLGALTGLGAATATGLWGLLTDNPADQQTVTSMSLYGLAGAFNFIVATRLAYAGKQILTEGIEETNLIITEGPWYSRLASNLMLRGVNSVLALGMLTYAGWYHANKKLNPEDDAHSPPTLEIVLTDSEFSHNLTLVERLHEDTEIKYPRVNTKDALSRGTTIANTHANDKDGAAIDKQLSIREIAIIKATKIANFDNPELIAALYLNLAMPSNVLNGDMPFPEATDMDLRVKAGSPYSQFSIDLFYDALERNPNLREDFQGRMKDGDVKITPKNRSSLDTILSRLDVTEFGLIRNYIEPLMKHMQESFDAHYERRGTNPPNNGSGIPRYSRENIAEALFMMVYTADEIKLAKAAAKKQIDSDPNCINRSEHETGFYQKHLPDKRRVAFVSGKPLFRDGKELINDVLADYVALTRYHDALKNRKEQNRNLPFEKRGQFEKDPKFSIGYTHIGDDDFRFSNMPIPLSRLPPNSGCRRQNEERDMQVVVGNSGHIVHPGSEAEITVEVDGNPLREDKLRVWLYKDGNNGSIDLGNNPTIVTPQNSLVIPAHLHTGRYPVEVDVLLSDRCGMYIKSELLVTNNVTADF
jgi:hypothetical protein